ncbi:hypothetical protein EDD15DRAFT_2305257 [Pisolithus albus]|nr:hypothetical protein EDD15DRAFT_2305257 [Pisolithus albus]
MLRAGTCGTFLSGTPSLTKTRSDLLRCWASHKQPYVVVALAEVNPIHGFFRGTLQVHAKRSSDPPTSTQRTTTLPLRRLRRRKCTRHTRPDHTPSSQRRVRFSLSAHAREVWVRKRTHRWHAALAGALAGSLAIMFEKRSRRIAIAQQLFVR